VDDSFSFVFSDIAVTSLFLYLSIS
jgi:Chaperonin 10 Kd subunit